MDRKEFELRTQTIKREVNPGLFSTVQGETRNDPRVREMAERIRDLRLSDRAAADELVEQNRGLIDEVRSEILGRYGVHLDLNELEEKIEARRQERLKAIHDTLIGDESDFEILQAFELTNEEDQLGEHSVESPLFNERTKMAFGAYLSSVRSYEAFVDYNQMFGVPSKNIGRAEEIRGDAHDEVARQVAEDLDLDFDTSRRLVAKIRDDVMPGSSEQEVYTKSALRLGKRLSKRYHGDIAEAIQDETKEVFQEPE